MSETAVRVQAVVFCLIMVLSQVALFATFPAAAAAAANTDDGDWPEFGDDETNDGNNSESTGPSEIAGIDWRAQTGTENIYSSPVVVNGTLYQGTEDGLHAFNTTDGTEEWQTNIDLDNDDDDSDRVDSPAYHDGYLYVGTADDGNSSIHKIDASDGSVVDSFDEPGKDFMGTATTVHNGSVYAADNGGTLWKVNASNMTEEEASFGTGGFEIQSEPAIADGYVYLGTDSDGGDSKLYALDATDLTKEDEETLGNSIMGGPVVENETVYFGTNGGALYARGTGTDLSTGPRVWEKTDAFGEDGGLKGVKGAPAVADGKLFVGSNDGTFRAFDVSDGSELWSYSAGDIVSASPAYVDDTVYVGTWSGDVFALNASTGNLNWEFPVYGAPDEIKASPAVVDGSVYVGDYSGDVYKLNTPDSGLPVSENFESDSVADDWVTGGTTSWGATVDGSSTLRLTEANDYEAGYAYYDRPFSSTSGAVVEFDYYSDEGDGADGLSFFLTNGSLTHRTNINVSSEGGSGLGYAQVDENDGNDDIDKESEQGVPNGYIGVGFDEYGLFSSGDEGKDGYKDDGKDRDATRPDHVAIRGVGDLGEFRDGYPYLTSTNVSEEFDETIDGGWRRARITTQPVDLDDDGLPDATDIRVEMSWDDGQTWETVTDYTYSEVPPDDLKLGFAGATGGANNVHAIDNLSVREPSDLSIGVTDTSTGGKAGEEINFEYEVT
ncbi:MAG: PQQ-binding-like beta-propeller repeat protein, partial [Halobacteriota archaeon]